MCLAWQDPSEATFYFLPSRCTAYRKSVVDLDQGMQVAGETMRKMVDDIRHRSDTVEPCQYELQGTVKNVCIIRTFAITVASVVVLGDFKMVCIKQAFALYRCSY